MPEKGRTATPNSVRVIGPEVCIWGDSIEMSSYPQPFAIHVAPREDGSVRVEVRGELDLLTSPQLAETLRREIDAGNRVVVDLSEIGFIDSTGLNTLITALRASSSNGGELMVSPSLPAQVQKVLEVTGLNQVLPLAAD
jgi:anti-sigma B factor antagonist